MVNEHHTTPSCMNASCNLSAAVLARITKNSKILLLGNILPIHENPVRLAEEVAMIDVISGGRVISGMVRGVGVETVATNVNPVDNQERLEECHDLVIKSWTTPETAEWAASHGYTYLAFLTPLEVTEVLFDIYRKQAATSGHDATSDNFGYLLCCYVAETQEKADEEARHFIWRMGTTTRGPRKYMNPVGYRSRAGEQVAARRNIQPPFTRVSKS